MQAPGDRVLKKKCLPGHNLTCPPCPQLGIFSYATQLPHHDMTPDSVSVQVRGNTSLQALGGSTESQKRLPPAQMPAGAVTETLTYFSVLG